MTTTPADEINTDWLTDYVRDAVAHVLSRVDPPHRPPAEVCADIAQNAALLVHASAQPVISNAVVRLACDHIREESSR